MTDLNRHIVAKYGEFLCDICSHEMKYHNFAGSFQMGCELCFKERKPDDVMGKFTHSFENKKLDILKDL